MAHMYRQAFVALSRTLNSLYNSSAAIGTRHVSCSTFRHFWNITVASPSPTTPLQTKYVTVLPTTPHRGIRR